MPLAVRFDDAADYVQRTTDMPSSQTFTAMGWYYISVSTAVPNFWVLSVAGKWVFCGRESGTAYTEANYTGIGFEAANGSALGTETWYHISMTRQDGGADPPINYWLNGVVDATITPADADWTPDNMQIGLWSGSGNQFNGRCAGFKLWSGLVLSEAQIQAEMTQYYPILKTSLYMATPFNGNILDISGNERNWTGAGALTYEDGPPIPLGAPSSGFIGLLGVGR